jgi:hypothetical protein
VIFSTDYHCISLSKSLVLPVGLGEPRRSLQLASGTDLLTDAGAPVSCGDIRRTIGIELG